MATCGHQLENGFTCGQRMGHEQWDVPHLSADQIAAYWAKRITEQRAEKTKKEKDNGNLD